MAKELLIFILLAAGQMVYAAVSYARYRRRVDYHKRKMEEEERRRKELGLGPQ